VIFGIERGQIDGCLIRECSVNVCFDEGRIRTFTALGSRDHDSRMLFIEDVEGFMAGMRKAKTVRIEGVFYHEGARTFEFPVSGFKW